MAPDLDDRQSHQDAGTDREPLVDINPEPTPSSEAPTQVKPRRKRLSDVQGQTDEPQPGAKPQRRCLSDVPQAEIEEPVSERPPSRGRPRLTRTPAQTAVMEMPEEAGTLSIYDGAPAHTQPSETTPAPSPADPVRIEQQIVEQRGKQSLSVAAAAGLLAAVVGAMLWAVVTTMTSLHIAWMAIPMGLLVGGVVRVLGGGLDRSFGRLGAALTLVGCLLGSHLTNCMFIARETGLATTAVLTQVNPAAIVRLVLGTLHPLDILFYGLALYEGYRFSFRRIAAAKAGAVPSNN